VAKKRETTAKETALPAEVVDAPTVTAIYAAYVARAENRHSRRLGASQIGKSCERALWYSFRWCGKEQFSGRMIRLFETGQAEEIRFVANLRQIGVEVQEVDPQTGQQWELTGVAGHFVCKLDGVGTGIPEAPKAWHTMEFKTHSLESFASLKSKGLKAAKPEHWAQCQAGMHLAQPIDRCLYLAVCKDTDELYAERVRYDPVEGGRLMARAASIVRATEPPERISQDPEWWECRFCAHRDRCHAPADGVAAPHEINCRTCAHSTPLMDAEGGQWRCERHAMPISEQQQHAACADHLFIPLLINGATPVDGSMTHVVFETPSGRRFDVGGGGHSSNALATTSAEALADPLVVALAAATGAKVCPPAIPDDAKPLAKFTLDAQRTSNSAAAKPTNQQAPTISASPLFR
jgi:hypothetical protein